jgi:ATP-dependent NAD(P)H-hydrate dehydratase
MKQLDFPKTWKDLMILQDSPQDNNRPLSSSQLYHQTVFLPLSPDAHKGTSGGRVGILGGSLDYTGAPYYAGMAALQTGADLVYIYTAQEATLPIKCYSPELMVSSVYSAESVQSAVQNDGGDEQQRALIETMVYNIVSQVCQRRLHCLIIGPGLGRNELVLQAVLESIQILQYRIALVLDADALFLLSQNDTAAKLFGDDSSPSSSPSSSSNHQETTRRKPIYLTPNAMEYKRLFGDDDSSALPSWTHDLTIVCKGNVDSIHYQDQHIVCEEAGGWKRSGGMGDILSGCLGTLVAWQELLSEAKEKKKEEETCDSNTPSDQDSASVLLPDNRLLVGWTACCLVKRATQQAFESKGRSMTAPDVLHVLGSVWKQMEDELTNNGNA